LNQDDDSDRSITAINKRVSNRGRQIGGVLLTASAAWLGIHLVTARGKGATISHSTAFTIAAGCWTLGALEFVRAGTIVEKKCERIVRNVQANLQL
jgi:cell division protein FtsB